MQGEGKIRPSRSDNTIDGPGEVEEVERREGKGGGCKAMARLRRRGKGGVRKGQGVWVLWSVDLDRAEHRIAGAQKTMHANLKDPAWPGQGGVGPCGWPLAGYMAPRECHGNIQR